MRVLRKTREQALREAITGVSRVADAIVAIPANARSKALTAAEASYRQSALDLGYNDSEAQNWVDAMMFRLRDEVNALLRASIDFLHINNVVDPTRSR
jgi:hypothetical protein